MRRLAVAIALSCSVPAWAQTPAMTTATVLAPSPLTIGITLAQWIFKDSKKVYYVEVTARGSSPEQARNEALRMAVERAVGSIVASESEAQNDRLVRNEIISYASGYVEDYRVVRNDFVNGQYIVSMQVWVSHSSLAKRLLNTSRSSDRVDGERAAVTVTTLQQERQTGDQLLQMVLNDFPKRAFNIDSDPPTVSMDQARNAVLGINFNLKWNYDYLESLWIALDRTSQKTNIVGNVTVISGPPSRNSSRWFGWRGTAGFSDLFKPAQVENTLILTRPAVLLTIKDGRNVTQLNRCYRWAELDHIVNYQYPNRYFVNTTSNSATINGDFNLRGRIDIPVTTYKLQQFDTVEMAVIRGSDCPN